MHHDGYFNQRLNSLKIEKYNLSLYVNNIMTYFQPCIFFFSRDIKNKKKPNIKINEIKENDKPPQETKNKT